MKKFGNLENNVYICKNMYNMDCFDTIIMIPSSNGLNGLVFEELVEIIKPEVSFESYFIELSAQEVFEDFDDMQFFERHPELSKYYGHLSKCFADMEKNNNGIFSYKYIRPTWLRDTIINSMKIDDIYLDELTYGEHINGKNVLIIDDTVTTGNSLTDASNAIIKMYDPKSITFLTLLTPLHN